ncbi:COG1470 family protein [Parapedobacter sp. DT-150]|uniref:COG1470 family protein n=1 Tax=Parapedobacter sp. DT-150 TaxID=3396162 RepID=UPI003F541BF8
MSWTATSGQGLSLSPSRIFFEGSPGQTATQLLTFTNRSDGDMTFSASIKDWQRDTLGRKIYFPAGELAQSNAGWLRLSASTITLNPGETKTVSVTLSVPENGFSGLTHSMVFFTQVKEQEPISETKSRLGVNVLLEVGIQVYNRPLGLAAGELAFLAFEDQGIVTTPTDTTRQMAVKIKNRGQVNRDAHVRFELTDMGTGEEIPVNTTAIAMLPDAEQWVYVQLPSHLKGKFLAIAILDAGGRYELNVAEKEITY